MTSPALPDAAAAWIAFLRGLRAGPGETWAAPAEAKRLKPLEQLVHWEGY